MQQVLLQALQKVRVWISMTEKSEIAICDIVDSLAVDSKKKPWKRLYHLPRTEDETHINVYNPALLLANQANC